MTTTRRVIFFLGLVLVLIGWQCRSKSGLPPAPPPLLADADGDGVTDAEDECPSEAGPRENRGCPVENLGDPDPGGDPEEPDPTDPTPTDPTLTNPRPVDPSPIPSNPTTTPLPVDGIGNPLIGFTSSDGSIGLNVVDRAGALSSAILDRRSSTATVSEREVLRQMIGHYQSKYTGADPAFDARLRQLIADLDQSVQTGGSAPELTEPEVPIDDVTSKVIDSDSLEVEPICLTGTYEKGVLSFNEIPPLLYLGKPYQVRIVIQHTATETATQTVIDRIEGENEEQRDRPVAPGEIPTGERMASPVSFQRFVQVELKTTATDGLRITERFERSVQEMTCGDSSQWQFIIEPLAEGIFPIFFNVLSGSTADDLTPLNEDLATRQIEVRVEEAPVAATGPEPVIAGKKDVIWLVVVGLLALALVGALLWWYFRGRKQGGAAKREVLWFMAQPSNTTELQLASEIQRTRNHVRNFEEQNDIRFDINPATTTQVLLDAVINSPARIVHFSGHGTTGGLYVLGDSGRYHALPNDALGRTFELLEGNVECVVLSSCYSETQAQIIASHIPYTIGFDREVIDDHTLKFSPVFYENYARGEDIRTCFERARLYLEMEAHAETAASLVLFEQGERVVFG